MAGSGSTWPSRKQLFKALLLVLVALVLLHSASSEPSQDFVPPGRQKREAPADLLSQMGRAVRGTLDAWIGPETMHLVSETTAQVLGTISSCLSVGFFALSGIAAQLLNALGLDVGCDQGPQDPVYLPAALELLDAPEHFRVQQVGRYPPANSSLGSRSETFLLLQPWPRAQPLLRASYPPFATQQVVPPRVAEPPHRPVPWDVRAVSVEVAVTPAGSLMEFSVDGLGQVTESLGLSFLTCKMYQEVPLDEAVTLRVPDVPVRPGQLFSATLLLRHNFTASVLTLRIKVKKGLHVMAARPAQPTLWTSKLDRFKGSKHHTTLITCHRAGPTGPDASPRELSEFLWVDFLVDNGTSGGLAVTRPVTWQLEYPGQAPEAEKDKMVWEIPVSERDIRALVPLAKAEELVNTAPLTGVPRRVPVRLVTVDSGGALVEVTEHIGCESANAQVLQVSAACDAVFVTGKESRGARGVRVDFWWRRLRASLWLTRTEEAGQGEEEEGEAEAREEEGEEEEMVPAPRRVTNLELGMYALLGIFCLAILIFLVNGVVFVLRYQRKEPPDSTPDPASPQPHNWVGTLRPTDGKALGGGAL
ncbi:Transmembrane protein 132A [Myotis davidii]|uniref:Transmembrane protein 132A n=1 Tax=Myotis davidii TaxID=225400 RepID=L5LKG5_MYODS|nr:Transmembrane protein 132A [Myotis davidii]